jgi:Ca2+-binding EF-hand superfamily protein
MPTNDVYQMTVNMICKSIKKKMEILSAVGQTNSDFRARKNLHRQFEYFDQQRLGIVSTDALQRVLHKINFPVEARHIAMLMTKYGDESGYFRYRSFVNKIYPQVEEPPLTSLPMGRDKGKELWEFMSSIDTDGDGTVSLQEMLDFKKSLPYAPTPPPCTPPTPGSPAQNMLSQIANLTTRKAEARPGSRQVMQIRNSPRPPTGSRVSRAGSRPPSTARLAPRVSRPPTGSRAYNVSRNGSMTARARSSSRASRPASRVLSRPGSRIAGTSR